MDSILRKGLFLVTLTGAIGVFPATAYASDIEDNHTMPGVGIEQVLNDCYSSQKEIQVEDYLTPEDKGEYLDMAFADVESFLYIRSEPTKQRACYLFNPNHILLFFYKVYARKYSSPWPHSSAFHDASQVPCVSFLFPLRPVTKEVLLHILPCLVCRHHPCKPQAAWYE